MSQSSDIPLRDHPSHDLGELTSGLHSRTPTSSHHERDPEHGVHRYSSQVDKLDLSTRIKTSDDIANIRANTSAKRRRSICLPRAGNASKLASFYENQNEQIERMLKPVHEHVREAKEVHESSHLKYRIAVYGSFVANICLSGLQLYGAISSGSLSLFTTMVDSVFDPLSNVTLILCNRAAAKADSLEYPAGKARIETAGNIFFSFIMMSVSVLLVAFSCQELAQGGESSFHLPSVIAVAIAFGTKLGLFMYCWALRNQYSQVRILWEDHRNDLFINGFGILTSVGGSKLAWWIDPMGAILLSCLIIILWFRTALGEFKLLIGVTAEPAFLQLVTYISMTHSDKFKAIDTVRAWHSGPKLLVEVDVVMEPEVTLRESHDLAEELQVKLESLPDVDRAYVHVDFETSHRPEHKKNV